MVYLLSFTLYVGLDTIIVGFFRPPYDHQHGMLINRSTKTSEYSSTSCRLTALSVTALWHLRISCCAVGSSSLKLTLRFKDTVHPQIPHSSPWMLTEARRLIPMHPNRGGTRRISTSRTVIVHGTSLPRLLGDRLLTIETDDDEQDTLCVWSATAPPPPPNVPVVYTCCCTTTCGRRWWMLWADAAEAGIPGDCVFPQHRTAY